MLILEGGDLGFSKSSPMVLCKGLTGLEPGFSVAHDWRNHRQASRTSHLVMPTCCPHSGIPAEEHTQK